MPLPYATVARVKTRLNLTSNDKDSLLAGLCEEVNSYIESVTRRAIGSSLVTNEVLDSWEHVQGGLVIDYPRGIRSITTLEVRASTNDAYVEVPATDYFLRPEEPYRTPGWPAFSICLSDLPVGTVSYIMPAYGAIRHTSQVGWSDMPADIRGVGEVAVARAFSAKQAGYADDVGVDEFGEITVGRFLSSHDYRTLRRYRWEVVEVI